MTAPLLQVIGPDQNTAGGYFFGYRLARPDGSYLDYLELTLADLTSATYANKGGTKYVNIGVQNITWTSPSGPVEGWSTQGLDSCSVVIARTPTSGISGTIDCTGETPLGADKVPYHAQGTFTAEP